MSFDLLKKSTPISASLGWKNVLLNSDRFFGGAGNLLILPAPVASVIVDRYTLSFCEKQGAVAIVLVKVAQRDVN